MALLEMKNIVKGFDGVGVLRDISISVEEGEILSVIGRSGSGKTTLLRCATMADATWTAIGLAAGTYLNWLITSKRLRRYSITVDAITIPDFFSNRFHEHEGSQEFQADFIFGRILERK